MDYKKKYKEAVGKIKELLEEKKKKEMTNCLFEGELNEIFSELRESEDEKIIKALTDEVSGWSEDTGFGRANIPRNNILAWLEKQGKQASDDKVEPKFKVGDYIIDVQGVETNKIVGYEDDSYIIRTSCSQFYLPMKLTEKNYRLWTIQDAKAGDVLYLQKDGKEHIIIYKGVIKERFRTFVSAYCAYNGIVDAICFADVSRYVDIAYGGIMPATKEQRDTLMKAMADDGYEWDAEKKELRKIENEIEIPSGAKDSELQEATYYIPKGFHAEIEGSNVIIKKGEQNTAWSEEDDSMYNRIVSFIPQHLTAESYTACINWLKSLRHQKQWKPSEGQLECLDYAIDKAEKDYSPLDNNRIHLTLKALKEQLKKL